MIIIVGGYSIVLLVCTSYEGERRTVTSRGTQFEGPVGKPFKIHQTTNVGAEGGGEKSCTCKFSSYLEPHSQATPSVLAEL